LLTWMSKPLELTFFSWNLGSQLFLNIASYGKLLFRGQSMYQPHRQDGMGTNPWRDPCGTWRCPPLDLIKFIANGGAHWSHPREENMVKEPRNKM
jgi:hypothetical protein